MENYMIEIEFIKIVLGLIITCGIIIVWKVQHKIKKDQSDFINDMQKVIDGYRSQAEHLKNMTELSKMMFDPNEIKNKMERQKEEISIKYEKIIKELKENKIDIKQAVIMVKAL